MEITEKLRILNNISLDKLKSLIKDNLVNCDFIFEDYIKNVNELDNKIAYFDDFFKSNQNIHSLRIYNEIQQDNGIHGYYNTSHKLYLNQRGYNSLDILVCNFTFDENGIKIGNIYNHKYFYLMDIYKIILKNQNDLVSYSGKSLMCMHNPFYDKSYYDEYDSIFNNINLRLKDLNIENFELINTLINSSDYINYDLYTISYNSKTEYIANINFNIEENIFEIYNFNTKSEELQNLIKLIFDVFNKYDIYYYSKKHNKIVTSYFFYKLKIKII